MLTVLLACSACAGSNDTSTRASSAAVGCKPGAALQGGTYDLAKSRFAFGSTPMQEASPMLTRWVGDHGVVAITAGGGELGIMNAGAPETNLPDFSGDPATLQKHVQDYFGSMGVQACQVSNANVLGGSGGRTIVLARASNGIPVVESNVNARFNNADQTTSEGFYWPTIAADVVTAAEALNARITDPASLAAYQALLPAEAQGTGSVVIHHSSSFSMDAFRSAATYDVEESGGSLGRGPTVSFDAQGMPVDSNW